MIISKSRYSNLLALIDAQKQIIDEYKKKSETLEETIELQKRAIKNMEKLLVCKERGE